MERKRGRAVVISIELAYAVETNKLEQCPAPRRLHWVHYDCDVVIYLLARMKAIPPHIQLPQQQITMHEKTISPVKSGYDLC